MYSTPCAFANFDVVAARSSDGHKSRGHCSLWDFGAGGTMPSGVPWGSEWSMLKKKLSSLELRSTYR